LKATARGNQNLFSPQQLTAAANLDDRLESIADGWKANAKAPLGLDRFPIILAFT
jgi:hypothetical protein